MLPVAKTTLLGPVYNIRPSTTKNGKAMTSFTMRIWKDQGEKEDKIFYLDCVSYSKAAEILGKYLVDGKIVYIEADINLFKDKDNNQKIQHIVREFSFL